MADTVREPGYLVEAAAQAAASGDYASAERLLREAARIQELRLGQEHPDVANTLNNLAIVCEIREKPEEAERCYRRAFAIATGALGPDHPFTVTSGNNLKAFCLGHGKAVDLVTPAEPSLGPEASGSDAASGLPEGSVTASSSAASSDPQAMSEEAPSRAFPSRFSRSLQIGSLAAIVLVLGLVVVFVGSPGKRPGGRSPDRREAGIGETAGSAASAREPSASGKVTAPSTPGPSSTSAAESVAAAPTAGATAASGRSAPRATAPTAAASAVATAPERTTSATLTGVAAALICTTLATRGEGGRPASWRCEPAKTPAPAGPLSFYTRIKSPRDTTVRHLWYQGDQLRQSVELQVRASPTEGYRTFSRFTVSSAAGSNWRVELRTDKGVLLHEERIAVR